MKTNSGHKSIEEEYGIKGPDGKPFEIPLEGSIGLLMLGYRGLMAWRAKRIETEKLRIEKQNETGK
jgi:hypothetical protein